MSKFFKKYFTDVLQKRIVFELLHLQNPYFYFLAHGTKMLQDIKKRPDMKTNQISFKSFQNFAENYRTAWNKFFPKLALSYIFSGQNTSLTYPKELFCYRNPVDSCPKYEKKESPKMTHPSMYSMFLLSGQRYLALVILATFRSSQLFLVFCSVKMDTYESFVHLTHPNKLWMF